MPWHDRLPTRSRRNSGSSSSFSHTAVPPAPLELDVHGWATGAPSADTVHLTAEKVGALLEALEQLFVQQHSAIHTPPTHSEWRFKLVRTHFDSWYGGFRIECEPYNYHPPRGNPHFQLPGAGLQGKTVYYRLLLPSKSSKRERHELSEVYLCSNDHFTRERSTFSRGSYVLVPSHEAIPHLPCNPSYADLRIDLRDKSKNKHVEFGPTVAFHCMGTTVDPKDGREETSWRMFWGQDPHATLEETDPDDWVRLFPGRMEVGPSSMLVVFKGPANPHYVAQRTGKERGRGVRTLAGRWLRRSSS
ncbi:hypothetical protein JCM6882_000866 [Rhodosporidiobolus microsporus]